MCIYIFYSVDLNQEHFSFDNQEKILQAVGEEIL